MRHRADFAGGYSAVAVARRTNRRSKEHLASCALGWRADVRRRAAHDVYLILNPVTARSAMGGIGIRRARGREMRAARRNVTGNL